ncbi:MAG: phosphotransferase [Dehalococcoidia bacterium]|nr:phosphotransferase [Dehalococcoidia bacterium]
MTAGNTGRVTAEEAEAFLREHYVGRIGGVAAIGDGEWSSAFGFQLEDQHRVVRFGFHRDDFERDLYVSRVSSVSLPVPRVLEIGEALGRHYAVSERLFGEYLDVLDGSAFATALPGLFEAMDAMRDVPLPGRQFGEIDGNGLAMFADWRTFLLSVVEPSDRLPGWRRNLGADSAGLGVFEDGLRMLESVAPSGIEPHLVHSDLLNFNVLVREGRLSGVLDWGCALAGDHLYDVAWLLYFQRTYPAWASVDLLGTARAHFARTGLAVPNLAPRLEACLLHIGLGDLRYNAFARRPEGIEAASRRMRQVMASSPT